MRLRGLLAALVLLAAAGASAAGGSWREWGSLGERGDAAFARDDLAAAEAAYREAIEMARSLGSPLALDPNMSPLVATWAARGRCAKVAREQREALRRLVESGRGESREALEPHSLLALITLAGGELDAATGHLRSLHSILEKTEGPDAPELAPVLNLLAFLRRSGSPEEADTLLERSLALRQKPLRSDPLDTAVSALQRAWTSPPAQASSRWRRALADSKRSVGARHPVVALGLRAYATRLEQLNQKAAAREARARADRILERPACDR